MDRKHLRVVLLLGCPTLGTAADASILARYTFDASSLSSSDTDALTTAGLFTEGPGITSATISTSFGNPAPTYQVQTNATGNSEASSYASGDYYEFVLTPSPGAEFTLSSLTLDIGRSSTLTGPTGYSLRTSIDGFAAPVGTVAGPSSNSTYNTRTFSLAGTAFTGIDEALTFRIALWDGENFSSNSHRTDNVVLNGESVLVPEPATLGLTLVAAAVCLARPRTNG